MIMSIQNGKMEWMVSHYRGRWDQIGKVRVFPSLNFGQQYEKSVFECVLAVHHHDHESSDTRYELIVLDALIVGGRSVAGQRMKERITSLQSLTRRELEGSWRKQPLPEEQISNKKTSFKIQEYFTAGNLFHPKGVNQMGRTEDTNPCRGLLFRPSMTPYYIGIDRFAMIFEKSCEFSKAVDAASDILK
mmetsp:Transcript_28713/g.39728  ORF Transcript_28713/g.39728 Transcript_28713/m.39728 type:complete len:189 (-) Transcript_28713:189-755(-)